jgi:hypothetical protein
VCLWLRYPAWDKGREAVKLSTACTSKLVDFLLRVEQQHWTSTSVDLAGIPLEVELRGMSPSSAGPVRLTRLDQERAQIHFLG